MPNPNITAADKIKLLLKVYATIFQQPLKYFLINLLRPLDAARYTEFAYLLNFLEARKISQVNILDVSSPHAIDYLLDNKNQVLKINLDPKEKKYIRDNKNLEFKSGDALNLEFSDNTFDLVISISVVEHIYGNYRQAIEEMIRVAKPGAYLYLTFPVAAAHVEEWSNKIVYSDSQRVGDKIFFQYRLAEQDVERVLAALPARLIARDIYWEAQDGMYDQMIRKLNNSRLPKLLQLLRLPFIQLYYGFSLFKGPASDFASASSFGMHLILQK
jgi:SAM-dependent methyltransferase